MAKLSIKELSTPSPVPEELLKRVLTNLGKQVTWEKSALPQLPFLFDALLQVASRAHQRISKLEEDIEIFHRVGGRDGSENFDITMV